MNRGVNQLVGVAVILFSLSSCISKSPKEIGEGRIEYDIEYDTLTLSRVDKKILPSSLIVRFYNNNTINTIDALSGAVTISIISQPAKKEFTTMLKIFNKKLYYSEPYTNGHYPALYARIPKVNVDTLVKDFDYIGYKCKSVMGYFADNPERKFEIIYTKQIAIDNPNLNTPFESIDGVMLGFNLRFNNVEMKLRACNVTKENINADAFKIPEDYKKVDFQTMTDLIYLLQQ
ncbi:MAG TPA: hypothetical protein ENN49_06290 [Bacteroidales bacterium]|nr:hypothetical protein [Bacteroidales bacterium]